MAKVPFVLPEPLIRAGGAALLLLALVAAATANPAGVLAVGVLLALLAVAAARNFSFAAVALVFLFPFIGLRFLLPPFETGFLARLFPDGVDVAVPVIFGLAVCAAWIAARLRHGPGARPFAAPLAVPFGIFLALALPSVVNAPSALLAMKYLVYPIGLAYLLNVALPATLLRTRTLLDQALAAFFWTGCAAAAMGFLSLGVVEPVAFPRASPFALLGVAPYGTNHNLLAETLVAVIPVGVWLTLSAAARHRATYAAGTILMTAVALLTFSRTAWLALALMTAAALVLRYRTEAARLWRPAAVAAVVVVPLFLFLIAAGGTSEVQGSNASRLSMSRFAVFLFRQHPLAGAGAGSFVTRIAGAEDFRRNFGDPIDAHGIVQKLLAETGLLGLFGWTLFWAVALHYLWRAWRGLPAGRDRDLLLFLFLSAAGSLFYQLFTTTYFTGKLWLPLGLAAAAARILAPRVRPRL